MGVLADATDPATPDDIPATVDQGESEVSPVQLTTTEEAKTYARRALDDYYGHTRKGEDAIAAEATQEANRARAALRAAQQRLMQDPYAPTQQELAQRQGVALMTPGQPTNGIRAYIAELANQSQAERERQSGLATTGLEYEKQIGNVNKDLFGLRQKLAADEEKNSASLAKQGLQTLGRGIAKDSALGGNKPLSPEGKQALDELGPDAVFTDPTTGKTDFTPLYHKRVSELVGAKVEDAHARAGTDATALSPDEHAKIADQAGVPALIASPYEGMSTKEKLQAQRIEENKASTIFPKYVDSDNQTRDLMSQVDHFLDINKHTHTGPELAGIGLPGVSAGPHGASVHGGEGWNINPVGFIRKFEPNIQDMDKVTNNLLTMMQKPGFSRVTNADLLVFQKGMMGIDKPYSVNKDISIPLKVWGQNALDQHEFLQNYFQTHHTLQGAEAQWNDYLNHNPIFDPTAPPGSYRMNTQRMPYQDYFRAKNHGINFKSVELPPSLGVDGAEAAKSQRSGIIQRPASQPAAGPNVATLLPPGMKSGQDQGAPPFRAPASQPDDEVPAVEPHATGGAVGYDDGGEVQEPGELEAMLQALRTGATLHASDHDVPGHPLTNVVGETAGGAGTVAALLALARLRGRLGRGAASVGRYAAENPVKAATIGGAGVGATAGALGAPPGDAGSYGLAYGLNGALLGPAAAFAGRGAAGRLQALRDRMQGLSPISTGDRRTVSAINADLQKAGGANWQDLTDMVRDDRRLGVPSTLADLPDMNSTRGLAKAALTKDTPEGRAYSQQLNERQEQAGTRAGDIVNNSLAPDPYMKQTDYLKEQLYKNAAPLYQQAYQMFPQVQSQTLMQIMNTPAGAEAAKRAFIKMQNKQRPIGQVNPQTGLVDKPSLEYLDNVKRSLDDMILREEGSGVNYQATDDGSILRGMREKLRNELDAATALPNGQPGPYQQARQQYGGDLEVLDALRSGREDFKSLSPEALTQKVANMSYAERDAFRSGVAEQFFRQLGSATEGVNPAGRLLSNPDVADKIGSIFDNPRQATRFISSLQREADMFNNAKPVMTAAKRGQENAVTPDSIVDLARSKMMTKDTANDINANMSTTSTNPDAMQRIQRLRDAADRLRQRDTVSKQAGVALGAGAAGAAVPSNNPQPDQETMQ